MKKKMVAMMLAAAMTAGLCACGSDNKTQEETKDAAVEATANEDKTADESTAATEAAGPETAESEAAAGTEAEVVTAAGNTEEVVTAAGNTEEVYVSGNTEEVITEAGSTEEVVTDDAAVDSTEEVEVVHYAYDTPASSTFEINADDCVKELADYSAVPINVSAEYEITEENENDTLYQILSNYGFDSTVEDTSHDTVEEGDWVNVDYTGYLDGEAFDGGSAEGQLIDVYNNSSVSGGSYIDGFTDALKGAKVGDTVEGNCTFPEDYSSTDLAGKEVTFEFTVNSIQKKITFADMTDEMVAQGIGASYGMDTVGDLKEAIDGLLSQNAYSEESDAVTNYLVENSDVEVPEDYLEARLNEYIALQADNYCADDQTFEEYLTGYGYTLDELKETWRESLKSSIASEMILQVIAEKEGVELDEDNFETRIEYLVSSYGYESDEALYSQYGSGDAEYGKKYMQELYTEQLALSKIIDTAVITYGDDTDAAEAVTEEVTEAVTE